MEFALTFGLIVPTITAIAAWAFLNPFAFLRAVFMLWRIPSLGQDLQMRLPASLRFVYSHESEDEPDDVEGAQAWAQTRRELRMVAGITAALGGIMAIVVFSYGIGLVAQR